MSPQQRPSEHTFVPGDSDLAADKLEQSELLFRQLTENIREVFWITDVRTGKVVYLSPAFEEVWGRPRAEVLEDPDLWRQYVHPDDLPGVLEHWRRQVEFLEQGKFNPADSTFEYRIYHADGQLRWACARIFPVPNTEGKVYRLAGVAEDVTERKHIEEERIRTLAAEQMARERVSQVLDSITDGFLTIDASWHFTYLNRQAEVLLRRPKEELLGKHVWDTYPDAIQTKYYHEYHRAMAEQVTVHFEEYYPPLDLWTEVRAYPSPTGLAVYFHDITARKRAEEALRISEERHRLITELTSDYAFVCTVNPGGDIRVDMVTEGFTRVTGFTIEEMSANGHWTDFVHPDDVADATAKLPRMYQNNQVVDELRVPTKSGEERWIRYLALPVWDEKEGRVVRLVGAVQDITERKRAEEKLRKYARRLQVLSRRSLEVQEQERRFLSRELHDEIGQDLTALKLAIEMGGRLEGSEQQAKLQQAKKEIQDLLGKIRDLSSRLRPPLLDDLGLFPALTWHIERYTKQTGVQVEFRERPPAGRLSPAIETAVYRIVQEALTNVARHARVGRAEVRVRVEPGRIRVRIRDYGAGFDVRRTDRRRRSGGLSGMRERARLLGGHLNIKSRLGGGTCVTGAIPLHNEQRNEEPWH